ncbi:MAG: Gx transporter family protein [bacterium]|nr:Gx transporter family protein [bacterium]
MMKQSRRIAVCGMLLALMLVLGFVESQLPVAASVPGIKLGLSNGVLIFAVYMLNVPTGFLLMGLKVLLSGLMFGSPSAMMYAFAGGLLSMIVMSLLSRMKGLSPVVVSMAGGVSHNVGQVAMAMMILQTPQLLYYMAVLMVAGLVTGMATGFAATGIIRRFQKENKHKL